MRKHPSAKRQHVIPFEEPFQPDITVPLIALADRFEPDIRIRRLQPPYAVRRGRQSLAVGEQLYRGCVTGLRSKT
jgi:hypothetical protein